MRKLSAELKEEFFKLLPPTAYFFVALYFVATPAPIISVFGA